MFDGKRINSLEQSVGTLTEELANANDTIRSLVDGIERIEDKYNALIENFNEYLRNVNTDINKVYKLYEEYEGKTSSVIKEETEKVAETISKLEEASNKADAEHASQINTLCKNNELLINKCRELQESNIQIAKQHSEMIERYERNIKEYQAQTQAMKNNILKKMNANNIISVVEE